MKNKISAEELRIAIIDNDYSLISFLEEYDDSGVLEQLDVDEYGFLSEVGVMAEDDNLVLDIEQALASDKYFGNYPLISKILKLTIPIVLKPALSNIFFNPEYVIVSFDSEFDYINKENEANGFYKLSEVADVFADINIVGNGFTLCGKEGEPISEFKNMKQECEVFKSKIADGIKEVENIFNYAKQYSNLMEQEIAINVKTYRIQYPDVDEVGAELLRRGFTMQSIEAVVTDEFINRKSVKYIEDGWRYFADSGMSGVEFSGSVGRSGGYAVFKLDFLDILKNAEEFADYSLRDFFENEGVELFDKTIDIDSIRAFSRWVEEGYNDVMKGETLDEVVEAIIEEGAVETFEQQQQRLLTEKTEALRRFSLDYRATKEFKMDGVSYLTLWGNHRLPDNRLKEVNIQMERVFFEADELNGSVVFKNLNDSQFGVERIEGGEVFIWQKQDVSKTYEDGEIKQYQEWVMVLDGLEIIDSKMDIKDELLDVYISPFVQDVKDKNKAQRETSRFDEPKNTATGVKNV